MSAWRIYMLLNPQRGTLGREVAKGYTLDLLTEAVQWASVHVPPVLDLEARCDKTGERWHRIKGRWSEAAAASPEPVSATLAKAVGAAPLTEEQRKRLYWMDKD